MGRRAAEGTLGRTLAGVLAWLLGAAGAVTVGALALSLIGSGLVDRSRPPLAAHVGGVTPAPSPTAPVKRTRSASPDATPIQRTFTFTMGSVTARCDDDQAYLVSWSPGQGYRLDEVHRGPALYTKVEFESLTTEGSILVRCVAGIPQATTKQERRH